MKQASRDLLWLATKKPSCPPKKSRLSLWKLKSMINAVNSEHWSFHKTYKLGHSQTHNWTLLHRTDSTWQQSNFCKAIQTMQHWNCSVIKGNWIVDVQSSERCLVWRLGCRQTLFYQRAVDLPPGGLLTRVPERTPILSSIWAPEIIRTNFYKFCQ